MNRNFESTGSQDEYKDVSLNNKCIRHSMNRIQFKYHRIGSYQIILITKYIFKRIISTWLPELIIKNKLLDNYSKMLPCRALCFNFSLVKTSFLLSILF